MPTINDALIAPPQQFSTSDGSIQGTVDGVNTVFLVNAFLPRARVFRNGIAMTLNTDCVAGGRAIVFLAGQVPQPGDVITVEGYFS